MVPMRGFQMRPPTLIKACIRNGFACKRFVESWFVNGIST